MKPKCCICGKPATCRVLMVFHGSYFKRWVCEAHSKLTKEDTAKKEK
jgi:hypothetical protein